MKELEKFTGQPEGTKATEAEEERSNVIYCFTLAQSLISP